MRFGFVVHPLTSFQRRLLGVRSLDIRLATGRPPISPTPCRIASFEVQDPCGRRAEGMLMAVPLLPESLLYDQRAGVEAVVEAVRACHRADVSIVGLGAVAAVIGGQGKAVAREAPCAVTTGNTCTAWAAVETLATYRRLGGRKGPVGLIGPPGPVSAAILRQLVMRGDEVTVVDATPATPLRRLAAELNARGPGHVAWADDAYRLLARGEVLIAASSTGGRLHLSSLPPGSVVIDGAAPVDVVKDVPRREDVLLLDGEYVRLPTPPRTSDFWRRIYGWVTGQDRYVFACFAEPMLLALAGRPMSMSLGRTVTLEQVDALAGLAASHGFCVDALFELGTPLRRSRLAGFSDRLP